MSIGLYISPNGWPCRFNVNNIEQRTISIHIFIRIFIRICISICKYARHGLSDV